MSAGSQIAAEIRAALVEAGQATGAGPLTCTLRKTARADVHWTGSSTVTYSDVVAIDSPTTKRDAAGQVLRVERTLLIDATGAVPEKGDHIAVGVASSAITVSTIFERIGEVRPLQPGGVALAYECILAD